MQKNEVHENYMKMVFALAIQGEGIASPNPKVGAVLVKDGHIVGKGFHKGPGTPHAERIAMDMAGIKSEGADLYINLEPCFHYGRTPPCVDAVIKSKVKKVFISNIDPNPLVNGKSVEKLMENGIEVSLGILEKEGAKLNEIFFKYIQTGIPFVALKAAASLDGKIATSTGESKWITGESSRQDSQSLRNIYDGILVGINTIVEDDPFLTCRLEGARNPFRIVLDSTLKISPEAKILNHLDSAEKTVIVTTKKASAEKISLIKDKAKVIVLEEEVIDLNVVLKKVSSLAITSILVEGGAKVHGSFINSKIPDKYYIYYAPVLIGGQESLGFFGGNGFQVLKNAPRLQFEEIKKIDNDLKVVLYPEKIGEK